MKTHGRIARSLAGATIAVVLVLTAAGAAAGATATSVSISSVSQSGTTLNVAGTATFVDQPALTVGTDNSGDALAPGEDKLGGDLTGAAIATLLNNKVVLSWTASELPAVVGGAPTGVLYGWDFCVADTNCFEVDAQRTGPVAGSSNPYGVLWSCADPSCTPADQTTVSESIPVTFGTPANTITATLTMAQIKAAAGSVITPVGLSTNGAVFTGIGDASAFTYFYNDADGVADIADYTVAGRAVQFAVAAPGSDPATLSYGTSVTPNAAGAFSGAVDVSGLAPGTYTVFARACFGSNNCAYAGQDVTI